MPFYKKKRVFDRDKILALARAHPGASPKDIARLTGASMPNVWNVLRAEALVRPSVSSDPAVLAMPGVSPDDLGLTRDQVDLLHRRAGELGYASWHHLARAVLGTVLTDDLFSAVLDD